MHAANIRGPKRRQADFGNIRFPKADAGPGFGPLFNCPKRCSSQCFWAFCFPKENFRSWKSAGEGRRFRPVRAESSRSQGTVYGPGPDSGKAEPAGPVFHSLRFSERSLGSKGGSVAPESEALAGDLGRESRKGARRSGAVPPVPRSGDSEGWQEGRRSPEPEGIRVGGDAGGSLAIPERRRTPAVPEPAGRGEAETFPVPRSEGQFRGGRSLSGVAGASWRLRTGGDRT